MKTELQKKALTHIYDVLNSVETYSVYSNISDDLTKLELSDDIKHRILNALDKSIKSNVGLKLSEANSWFEVIIKDL